MVQTTNMEWRRRIRVQHFYPAQIFSCLTSAAGRHGMIQVIFSVMTIPPDFTRGASGNGVWKCVWMKTALLAPIQRLLFVSSCAVRRASGGSEAAKRRAVLLHHGFTATVDMNAR